MNADAELADLPSPPRALAAVIRAARSADVSLETLGKLVGADPGFAVRVLKVANSPIYGQRSRISSVRRAITVLGARSLRNIALCAATHACVSRSRLGSFDLTRFWEASIQRACAARLLAAHDETLDVDPAEAFTASLLQDLGVVALIMRQPEVGERWDTLARLPPETRREQERTLCGHSHDELAVELSTAWGLAPELAIPMRYHHEPHRAPAVGRDRAQLAHDAEVLASVLSTSDPKLALAAAREMIDRRAGVNVTAEALLSELPSVVDDAARALGLAIDAQPSLQEILVDANRGLSELNLSYEEVLQRLERALEEKEHLARALQARNRELEQLSLTDELTGLPNRRAFWGRAVYELNRIARSGEGLCVAMGDLDHFKSVNDGHGHDFGDRVLEAVAGSLSNTVRAADMVARIGGEEFAIILPGTDLEGGLVAARKLNLAIQAMEMTTPRGDVFRPTISLGVTCVMGPRKNSFDADDLILRMLKRADRALYAAKAAGRNRVAHEPEQLNWG